MNPEEIMEFFLGYGLHISDGISPCSGEDYEEMRRAADELSRKIDEQRKADWQPPPDFQGE